MGGTVTQGIGQCHVTVQAPSGNVTITGNLPGVDHWTITDVTGFSSCDFVGTCMPRNGTCTNCTGVDAPVACSNGTTMAGTPSCTNNRPSCSLGTTGSALSFAHVVCVR
jgi:hypothetical protein